MAIKMVCWPKDLALGGFNGLMMTTVAFIMVCGPMLTVNVDARTLKFGMKHPWTQSLRFRKNKLGG